MSRNFLAIGIHGQAALGRERRVSLRIFDGHVHRLASLGLAEGGIIVAAFYLAVLARFHGFSTSFASFQAAAEFLWPRALVVAAVFLLSLTALGLYQLRQRAGFNGVVARLVLAVALAEAILACVFYVSPAVFLGRGVTALVGAFALVGLAATRFAFLRLVDEDIFKRRVLVWGAGSRAATIEKRLRRRTDRRGFRVVGYVPAPGDDSAAPHGLLLQPQAGLARLALRHRVEEIVVAMNDQRAGFPGAELLECRLHGIEVSDLVSFLERESGRVSVELMRPSWLIFSNGFRCNIVRLASKRAFDLAAGLAVLVLGLPLAIVAAAAIKLEDGGPVLYRQVRVGRDGRLFTILKFRSMRVDAELPGRPAWASARDPRVTRAGRVMRKLRVDELPQVLNVLAGDMSFVGPRPERPEFVETLSRTIPFYGERHFVKPGITGWAQVRYSYGASREDAREKLEFDLYYVKHHSLLFDLMVLLQTVEIVLFRVGAR